jgi:DNA primase
VREDWGKYHCFGCGESGDIISFVMKTENLEFKEALLELAQMAGLKMPDYKPKSPEQAARESSYLEIVEAATKIYQQKLYEESGADALRYIRGRGFSEETIKKYRIGYAPRGSVITAKFSGQKLANLIATGLVRSGDNGSYDFFRDKLMFPITNAKGEVIAFSGRSMDGSEPKYINTADTELFHKRGTIFGLSFARDAIHRNNRSIIVEGQIDAIQMQTHGFPETVAPLGTALTEDHLAIIAKHNRNIIFCFDGDGAGQKAAARACGLCMALMRDNSEIKFAFVSGGKDPDEILRGGPDGTANMKKIIDGAAPLAEFLWELANKNYLVSTPGGRAQAEKFLKSEIEKITDPLLKNEFTKEYDQRKFNQWHKWKKADGMGHKTNNPVPEVDSLTKKTLSYIIETFPELAEKHYEFLQKFGAAETGASAGFMTAESAEKFIVSLKLKCYLESLQNERNELLKNALLGENSGVERINVIDAEIKKSRERLELVVGDSG